MSGQHGASSASQQVKNPVVCVFCGAYPGTSPAHMEAARALAHIFHKNNITLVYGGGTGGIMGEIAKTLVSLSGPNSVYGIIPKALMAFEQTNTPGGPDPAVFGQMTVVDDMHTRKRAMADKVREGGPGSGFVALSGGFGTMEELFEVITWNQLGIHHLAIVVFNVDGYYDGIFAWVKNAVKAGFLKPQNSGIVVEATGAEEVIKALKEYKNSEAKMLLSWDVLSPTTESNRQLE